MLSRQGAADHLAAVTAGVAVTDSVAAIVVAGHPVAVIVFAVGIEAAGIVFVVGIEAAGIVVAAVLIPVRCYAG